MCLLDLVPVRDHGQRLSLLPLGRPLQQLRRRLAHHLHLLHRPLLLLLGDLGPRFHALFAPDFPAELLHDLLALVLLDQDPGDLPQVLIVSPILVLEFVLYNVILKLRGGAHQAQLIFHLAQKHLEGTFFQKGEILSEFLLVQ